MSEVKAEDEKRQMKAKSDGRTERAEREARAREQADERERDAME
jgi:hypothetical protein